MQPQPSVGDNAAKPVGASSLDDVGARDTTAARDAAGLAARAMMVRAAAGPVSERDSRLPPGWDMVLKGSPGKYYKRYVGPGQQRAMSIKTAWQVHVQHEEAKARRLMRLEAEREDHRLAVASGGAAEDEPQQGSSAVAQLLPPMAVEVDVLEAYADVGEQRDLEEGLKCDLAPACTKRAHGEEQPVLMPVAAEQEAAQGEVGRRGRAPCWSWSSPSLCPSRSGQSRGKS